MSYLAAFIYGVALFFIQRYFPFSSLFLSAVAAALMLCAGPRGQKFLVLIVAVAGFFSARLTSVPPQPLPDIAGETMEVCGSPVSAAVRFEGEGDVFSQVLEVKSAAGAVSGGRFPGLKELRIISAAALAPGKDYCMRVHIPRDVYSLNPGTYRNIPSAYGEEARETGPSPGGSFLKEVFGNARTRLNEGIRKNFSPEAASFLMSITTGERGFLTKETNNAFSITGLAHILSISGSHFGLLFLVLFGISRFFLKMLPYRFFARLTVSITPSQAAAVLSAPFIAGYLGISDMSPPAVRSFIMIMLFLFGLLVQRKGFWLNTLLFAAAVILVAQPDSLLNLSFQLSFIAVLGIGMAVGGQESGLRPMGSDGSAEGTEAEARAKTPALPPDRRQRFLASVLGYFRSSLRISFAATAGTAPLVAYYFHYFSVLSPATNLVITPVIGLIILPAALFSSLFFLISGSFPFHGLIDMITSFTLSVIKYTAQWDFAAMRIPAFPPILLITFYSGLLLFVLRRTAPGRACRVLPPLIIAILPLVMYAVIRLGETGGLQVTYLDVGQGDAAVVELPDRRVLVIDTGRNGFGVGDFLRYRGIRRIDAVVLSHGQSDHAGGLRYLIDTFAVGEVWDNGRLSYAHALPAKTVHRVFRRGDTARGDGYEITAFHPYDGFYTGGSGDTYENNDSLVVKIGGKKNAFLFTGDVGREAEENIAHLGPRLRSAVLKVPHHGSRSAAAGEFFRSVSPEVAVISLGRKNPYGHPHEEVLGALGNAKVLRTDRDGAVNISEQPDGTLRIRTWGGSRLEPAERIGKELVNFKKLFLVW